MATVASLVANPIVLRNPQPKFSAAKLSTTFNRRRHASCAPKFKVDVKCFLSAAENQYLTTTTTDSQKSGRHGSVCNAIKDHLGFGKPLGRLGGTWSSSYPYDPKYPDDCPWTLAVLYTLLSPVWAIPLCGQIWWPMYFKAFIMITLVAVMAQHSWSYGETSVVKLQVGFSGKGREIQMDLNRIAQAADTSTYKGLSYVLNETIVALLRHHKYYNSSSVSVISKFGREAANSYVDELSINERVNNKETLVNVNDMKIQSSTSQASVNDWHNDDIMVTLFVGAKGKLELPAIYDKYDLKNVLQQLRLIGSSNYMTAVEVLWTPQLSSCSCDNCFFSDEGLVSKGV